MASPKYAGFQAPTDYSVEAQRIESNRKLAEALRQQADTPVPNGTMAGGYFVPTSPLTHMANALKGYTAIKAGQTADTEAKDLATKRQEALVTALGGMPKAQTQSTAGMGMTGGLDSQDYQPGAAPGDSVTVQPTMQDKTAWLGQLASIGPDALNIGSTVIGMEQKQQESADQRAFREQQAKATRDQRMAELKMRSEDMRIAAADRAAAAKELAAMNNAARADIAAQAAAARRDVAEMARAQGAKPPPGFRNTPEGNLERIPGGPADIKAEAELQKKSAGAGDVDVALGTLRDAYNRLEEGGGITSTGNSALGNVAPAIASTGVGQTIGKLFGTNNQSARNDIAMARPALLAALMKATGMSAKQMDSNAELKLWLSTATDPTLDVESNRRALDNIEKKYITPAPQRRSSDKPGASGEWAVVK